MEIPLPVSTAVSGGQGRSATRCVRDWLQRLLACNPFYMVSAALLLLGMNRVSLDPQFLRTELAQLTFNFTSLQLYEVLLVGTAILLARRAVWYDSALLLTLENLLVLVPFILVSQAAFMEAGMVWTFCALAVGLAGLRAGAARRFLTGFKPSPCLLALGGLVLAVNTALPVIYRHLHEFKVGTRPTSGTAFAVNEASWLWVLPILCALTSLLPHPRENGKLPVQRRWFPMVLCLLWLLGTGVHLYSLGYVFDFALRRELLAPALWVLTWVLYLRLDVFITAPAPALRTLVTALPLGATWVATAVPDSRVFLILTALNVAAFAGVALFDRTNRLARQLLLITVALLMATLPPLRSGAQVTTVAAPMDWLALAAAGYLVLCTVLSRSPKLALAGALAAGMLAGLWRQPHGDALLWTSQAGLVFWLLHSLRWRDYEHTGAAVLRYGIAGMWLAHSSFWAHRAGAGWTLAGLATAVLAACWLQWWLRRKLPPPVVPIAGALVALLGPAEWAVRQLQATPAGLVAIFGSFVLFGAGTTLALTKRNWYHVQTASHRS